MRFKLYQSGPRSAGYIGFALVLAVGLLLRPAHLRLADRLSKSSYDCYYDFSPFSQPNIQTNNAVIVYLDDASYLDLGQPWNVPWDRKIHAKLLDRLTEEGAKAVVFDVIFSDPGPDPEADKIFSEAIRKNGKVILGVDEFLTPYGASQPLASLSKRVYPHELFRKAAAGLGLALLQPDSDLIIRQLAAAPSDFEPGDLGGLSWAAAAMVGGKTASGLRRHVGERWVHYYGEAETVPHASYHECFKPAVLPPGFFKDKVVFIGSRNSTQLASQRRDEFRSSFSSWNRQFVFMPAVEVHATMFLNLTRGDWLSRLSPASELALMLGAALVFGYWLPRFRPVAATGIALAGAVVVAGGAGLLFGLRQTWFPWIALAVGQIPVGLFSSVVFNSVDWYIQKRKLEASRREAEKRIHEQAALLDKAQDAIIVHNLLWEISFWNKSAEDLYGWRREEAVGMNLKSLLYARDPETVGTAQQAVLSKNEWIGELKQATRKGQDVLVQSRWTLVRDAAGAPASILVINTDITERKSLELQAYRAQRMDSLGILAGGIAHDLNNILQPVIMSVDLLRGRTPEGPDLRLLETVKASAKRGADLVKQVLTFARGHEGEKQVLQLRHLVREMDKIIGETFPKSITSECDVDGKLWPILGDSTQLHQILLNFCVNARDAMPYGGMISLSASNLVMSEKQAASILGARPGRYVVMKVSDTGSGIAPEILDKIFEPFFTTKEVGKGTGLGLSTVASIVKGHGGLVDVKSEVSVGTTFAVYFPAAEISATQAAVRPAETPFKGNGEIVLIVDDERAIREVLQAFLTENGFQVYTAGDGGEALGFCGRREHNPDLIIIDMTMPVLDGTATIPLLRKITPNSKIIAMSGVAKPETANESVGAHINGFVSKPFSTERIMQEMERVLTLVKPGRETGSAQN